MATSPKRATFTSPRGLFKYPSLSKPDFGNDQVPKPDGEYKTAVVVPVEDAQELIDLLTPLWDESIEQGQAAFKELKLEQRKKLGALKEQPFYETEYDQVSEEPTGNVVFKFKTKYKIVDKKTNEVRFNKIGLFDSKGKPLAAGTAIYGGTIGKIAFQVSPYFISGQGMAGITLRLSAVQVIDLVGPGARSSSAYGFGAEEGYDTSEDDAFPTEGESTPEQVSPSSNGNEDF